MNMNGLLYFRTLARLEHYGRAAQELHISQPSLSHAIASLEGQLGTRLFERRGRNVVLTKYGRMFAQDVEAAFVGLEAGEKRLRRLTSAAEGRVDLAFFHTLGVHFVPGLIRAFLADSPGSGDCARFRLRQSNTDEIMKGLQDGRYDLGFSSYVDPDEYPAIESRSIARQEIGFLVPERHPLAALERIPLAAAAEHPLVAFSKGSGLRPVIEGILRKAKVVPDVAYEAEQGDCVAGLVAAEFGISIMPQIPLPRLAVRFIPTVEDVPPREICIARAKERYTTEPVEAFWGYVLENGGAHRIS